ncbi:hypothetical protein [Rhizobium leguminosarum]|nr:hypothetical protein [Rhizobium leguminosarum]
MTTVLTVAIINVGSLAAIFFFRRSIAAVAITIAALTGITFAMGGLI